MLRSKTRIELRREIETKVAEWLANGNEVKILPATKKRISGWKQWQGQYMGVAHIER